MSKKLTALILVSVAIIGGSFFVYSKLKARKLRQELYTAAQNAKAEEITLKFLEGWNNKEIAEYLEKQGVVSQKEFLQATKNFNAPGVPNGIAPLQGYLYPDTYRFFKSIADRSQTSAVDASNIIIKKLIDNFQNKLPKDAESKAKAQGLSLYQAITLASIVEKEANNYKDEKATIAGIFYNRIKIGMPLQSDATVNYATGKSEASPSLVDLEVDSPYNTYKHKGLPPTPICNPSLASITAVLSPIKSEYLYYLHSQNTGEPFFAKSYDEHLKNKSKYLK